MSRTYSAGIATAYGAAVRGGYTGTYDEFCAALGDLARVLTEFENFRATAQTLAEGQDATASYTNGILTLGIPTGNTGNGIRSISLLSTVGLIKTYRITYTNDNVFDFPVADGKGIKSTVLNSDYTLTITYTDDTTWTSTSIRGEVGATPQFSIGTVETLLPTQPASATITGTPERPVLNLAIPRGQPGQDGASDAGAVTYNQETDYNDGTVGKELNNLNRQLSDVEENQIPELKSVLTKEDKLNTHQIGIVDYYSLNYQKFSEWTSNNSTLSIQDDGSLKGTVNSGKTRIILSFAPNWGLPKTTTIAIRLRAKFSKSVQATLSLRKTNALWAWSTAVSFGANVEKEVIYIVTTAQEIINSFALSTEADSLTADDYCIVSKCDIVNLDASPWNTSAKFRAACWNSDNRINDPYEILRMDNIPNSTFTYQNVGGVITITNELKCLGFQGNIRTDVITNDGTDVTEVRTLATPPCSMTIVTNKTTKNGSVTTNGI